MAESLSPNAQTPRNKKKATRSEPETRRTMQTTVHYTCLDCDHTWIPPSFEITFGAYCPRCRSTNIRTNRSAERY